MFGDTVSEAIIGAAIEVHRGLGPGLLESVYEECFCRELQLRELKFERQVTVPVVYKGATLDCHYRMDVVVEDRIVVEIKSVDALSSLHVAQLLTYLKITRFETGLLINFNVPALKHGLRRIHHKKLLRLPDSPPPCNPRSASAQPPALTLAISRRSASSMASSLSNLSALPKVISEAMAFHLSSSTEPYWLLKAAYSPLTVRNLAWT
jgi:GxxExxY protein